MKAKQRLRPENRHEGSGRRTVLSLFTGAGGLDIGLEAAGFQTKLCVEVNEDAQETLRLNRPHWTLASPGDVHLHEPASLLEQGGLKIGDIDLLVGGPPCQPFSKSAYWTRSGSTRLEDPRAATLTAYLSLVEASLPRMLLLENVRGLTFSGKDEGLQLLLNGVREINSRNNTRYNLTAININSADFGVPQFRERVFLIASKDGKVFKKPNPTHGPTCARAYRTTWDAIGDLDSKTWPKELSASGKWARLLPSIPEGENYLWHTPGCGGEPLFGWRTRYWSFLLKLAKDRPSWTIQAEPGPATGPFHWRSRLLSVRELCRLQTFPDDYRIIGDRRSAQRQLGNAVPCAIAEVLGIELRRQLLGEDVTHAATLIPPPRPQCPPPEPVRRIASEYVPLRGNHRPHPGSGQGPGATRRLEESSSAPGAA